MARDRIKSLAVLPNSSDNFNEVWIVVQRANGRMVERFTRRLKETSCGDTNVLLDELVFMDSAVTYDEGQVVTQVTISTGNIYTITSAGHGYSNGDTVVLRNVAGYPALSNTKWTITGVTTDTFELQTQVS